MSEPESAEVLQPPKKSSVQLVEELVERFAVALVAENDEHRQYMSTYPLRTDSLGLISVGEPDVVFEKFVELTDSPEVISYSVYVGNGNDTIFTLRLFDGIPYGGYGEANIAGDKSLDPDDIHPFLTKLWAQMWLHERGLDADTDLEVIAQLVKETVLALAHTPSSDFGPERDLADTYAVPADNNIWNAIRVDRSWFSEEQAMYQLSLIDNSAQYSPNEIMDVSVMDGDIRPHVTDYSGSNFDDAESLRRALLLFLTLAEALAAEHIVLH